MRIERKGRVEPLTPRWQRFLKEALRGTSLDDVQSPETLRGDYSCLSGLIAVELKSLEEDGSERMDNLTDELRQRPDWPHFYGSAPVQSMLKHLDDSEAVRLQFVSRMGRALINHLKKANKQLGAHGANFPRKNQLRLVLMVNEDHELYEPMIVGYIVQHALKREDNGVPLYPNIDAVLYTSERHAAQVGGKVAFPILSIEGRGIEAAIWKRSIMELILHRWAIWNGLPVYRSKPQDGMFATIDHVPERMPRGDKWSLDYRRSPYMRAWDFEALRDRFDEAMCVLTLAQLKDSPLKIDTKNAQSALEMLTHVNIEKNERGITTEQFAMVPERFAAAARRIGLGELAAKWFENMKRT